ncbi:MAG: hypothetical protein ABII64_00950 [Elusimicrobiota bacterium]
MDGIGYVTKIVELNASYMRLAFAILSVVIALFTFIMIYVLFKMHNEIKELHDEREKFRDKSDKVDGIATKLDNEPIEQPQEYKEEIEINKEYWLQISNKTSMSFTEEIIKSVEQYAKEKQRVRYLQSYIALGLDVKAKDYAWFWPRITEGMCYVQIRYKAEQVDSIIETLKNAGIDCYKGYNEVDVLIPSQANTTDNEEKKKIIKYLVQKAYESAKNN